jgi:hypothetical protein
MSTRELALLALTGFGIWLSGAVTIRFAGALMFESGPAILAVTAVAMAATVCLLLNMIMGWRKAPRSQAVPVAVALITPGMFGEVAYILNFTAFSGLRPETAGAYAVVMIFATAVLLAYALIRGRPAAT